MNGKFYEGLFRRLRHNIWLGSLLLLLVLDGCSAQSRASPPPPYQGNDPTVTIYSDFVIKFPSGDCNGETLLNFDNGAHQPEVATGAFVLGSLPSPWDTIVSACGNGGPAVDPWYQPVVLLKRSDSADPPSCYDKLAAASHLVPASKPRAPIKQGARVCVYTRTGRIALMTIISEPNAAHRTYTAKATLWGPG
jgi:hypothetical protein